ncbi:MAG: tyrosine-type recombinase/integrase [Chromatiales bacterium]|nr:tyrosine-type recombinase/integrase [Chromatiales bacterium]
MASYEPRGDSVRAVVRLPGGKKKSATFDTMAEAEYWGEEMERRKAVNKVEGIRGASMTVGQLFDAYLVAVASKTDSAKWNHLRIVKWLSDPIAELKLGKVITHDVNEWIERRLTTPDSKGRTVSPATVNRELNLMSAAFSYGIKDRHWLMVNPCYGARRPERGRPRKRPLLSPSEIRALEISTGLASDPELRTLTARVGASFLLALETGMRSGEILRLRPADYWRDRKTIHVAAIERGGRKSSRSGRAQVDPSRNVPLTRRAIKVLDALVASMPADQLPKPGFTRPPYIVGLDDSQRDSLWRKARDMAGIEDLHYHDLKHEAATRLAKHLDVLELSYAIGTKDVRLLRDTYYAADASRSAALLPESLTPMETD